MATNSLQERTARYFKLNTQIAQIDEQRLHALFEQNEPSYGWGRAYTIEIGNEKVFVKRMPVTQIEYDHMFSTKNLYNLPTYYNYGVGSAGRGVYRELIAHIKTTNGVLQGAVFQFPLMYHYRFRPFSGERTTVIDDLDAYVSYWGGSEQVRNYVQDRSVAPYELVLFLEYIPWVLDSWLPKNPHKTGHVLHDLRDAIAFLGSQGMIHFDALYSNVLTDGERMYLTDFGLVLDQSFDLSDEEKAFFIAHTDYDYGEVLEGLESLIYDAYASLPVEERQAMRRFGIDANSSDQQIVSILRNNVEALSADGVLKLDPVYVTNLVKYRDAIKLVSDFFAELADNPAKDTEFPQADLRRQLKATGFIS
jgi:serine/threonine protein kinase